VLATMKVHMREEQLFAIQTHAVGNTHVADMAIWLAE
jgi:hypothetical protein